MLKISVAANLAVLMVLFSFACERDKSVDWKVVEGGMVLIPAGEFMMGCNEENFCGVNEYPYHRVYLDDFYIDKHEVTVEQYGQCVQAGKCRKSGSKRDKECCNQRYPDRGNHPINCIDWQQARKYCQWAGKRLPTEAEWEKAARGTDGRKYPWGDQTASCDYAVMYEKGNGDGCGRNSTWPVGSRPAGASPYGVMDMVGNVWEWVADWYDENYYSKSPPSNPQGPSSGEYPIQRGGSWKGTHVSLRAGFRYDLNPIARSCYGGVRCVR